jgi:hypothetical protein
VQKPVRLRSVAASDPGGPRRALQVSSSFFLSLTKHFLWRVYVL